MSSTLLLALIFAVAGTALGALLSPRFRNPAMAGGVLGFLGGLALGWFVGYLIANPPSLTPLYAAMLPAVVLSAIVSTLVGVRTWRQLPGSNATGAMVGAASGVIGTWLIMNPLRACTFEADRTGLDRALGTGVSIVGGVLLLTIIAGIYTGYSRAAGKLPPKTDPFSKGGFRGHHLTPWLLLAPTLVILVFFLYSPTIETMRMSVHAVMLSTPRRPFRCLDNYTALMEPTVEVWAVVPLVLFVVAAITIFFLRRRPLEVGDHPVPRWLNNSYNLLLVVTVVAWGTAVFAAGRGTRRPQLVFINTVILTTGTVILSLAIGLGVAMLVSQKIRGRAIYRTFLIWPFAVSPPIAGILFDRLFAVDGLIAAWFNDITGNDFPNYKTSVTFARVTVILASVWKSIGFTIVFYIAGLQNVPTDTLEAAELDGANRWERIRYVTLPALTPITFFLLISTVTYSFFEIYGTIVRTTGGGPSLATRDMMTQVIVTGRDDQQFGAGAAQSMLLFAMVLAVTAWQFRSTGKRVEYGR